MGVDGAPGARMQRAHARRPALGRIQARHLGPGGSRAQHPARHDALVARARAGEVGRHRLVPADDLDGRACEAAGMRATRPVTSRSASGSRSGAASHSRDYHRRKKRGPIRKTGRPIWRQPLMLGLVVLLLGAGGGGGWWAWREGWLVTVQAELDAVTR